MNLKTVIGLASVGAACTTLSGYLLRRRPKRLKYVAGGAAFLLPFGLYALSTKVTGSPRTSFLFISDTHGTTNSNLATAMLNEDNVDFVVHGGDIADSEEFWRPWWDTPFAAVIQRWPVYATRGNHDPETGFRQRFNRMPPYRLQVQGVDLFFLPYQVNATTAQWLEREVASSASSIRILVTHRPIWPASGEANNLPQLLAASLPYFNLVLAGHDHVSWDYTGTVGHGQLRQVIEKSGPKNYSCRVAGCVERSVGYLRVDVYPDRVEVQRRTVP